MNIVVVDDENIILNAVSRVLTRSGHKVHSFATCQDALSNIASIDPGFMFLDVKMPKSSGLDLLKEIRAMGINAKAVMMSGYTTPEIVDAAKELGVVAVLKKPFDNIYDIVKVVEDNSH